MKRSSDEWLHRENQATTAAEEAARSVQATAEWASRERAAEHSTTRLLASLPDPPADAVRVARETIAQARRNQERARTQHRADQERLDTALSRLDSLLQRVKEAWQRACAQAGTRTLAARGYDRLIQEARPRWTDEAGFFAAMARRLEAAQQQALTMQQEADQQLRTAQEVGREARPQHGPPGLAGQPGLPAPPGAAPKLAGNSFPPPPPLLQRTPAPASTRHAGAPKNPAGALAWNAWCPTGDGRCGHCNGKGCHQCGSTGKCANCTGTGVNKGEHCGSCNNNRDDAGTPQFYVPPWLRTSASLAERMKRRRRGREGRR